MTDFSPTTTSEMVFADADDKRVLNDIITRKISFPSNGKNCLLLYGTYGSGKTTYAKVFFNDYEKAFGGDNPMIDTITNESGDAITQQIAHMNTTANFASFNDSSKHYFLIDEVDTYSTAQQQRLKSFLNRKDIIVVLTTNFIKEVDDGLLSRSISIDFNASNNAYDYVVRMKQIIRQHNLPTVSDKSLTRIAQAAEGDWREINQQLEEVCMNISPSAPPPPTKPILRVV